MQKYYCVPSWLVVADSKLISSVADDAMLVLVGELGGVLPNSTIPAQVEERPLSNEPRNKVNPLVNKPRNEVNV